MDLKQLKTFKAVMDSGRVSSAATQVGMTQPAVSKIILGLEADIGIRLFKREKGKLLPTPEAHYLKSIANNVIGQINDAQQFLRDYGARQAGDLKILTIPGPSSYFIPDLAANFLKDTNEVTLSLLTSNTAQVVNWIADNQSGVGLAEWFRPHEAVKLHTVSIPCICAMSANHALAEKTFLTPHDLHKGEIALINSAHAQHGEIIDTFAKAGCTPKVRVESDLFLPVFTFLKRSNIVAFVDRINQRNYELSSKGDPDIVFRPFVPSIVLKMTVVYPAHRPLSFLSKSFLETLIQALEQLSLPEEK